MPTTEAPVGQPAAAAAEPWAEATVVSIVLPCPNEADTLRMKVAVVPAPRRESGVGARV